MPHRCVSTLEVPCVSVLGAGTYLIDTPPPFLPRGGCLRRGRGGKARGVSVRSAPGLEVDRAQEERRSASRMARRALVC